MNQVNQMPIWKVLNKLSIFNCCRARAKTKAAPRIWGQVAAVLLVGLLSATWAVAQMGGSGTIQGTITDNTGAALPGATVTVTNVNTGTKRTTVTTHSGNYSVPALNAGTYKVKVSDSGFRTVTQPNVVVDALAVVAVNLKLPVGSTSSTVTVSAAPPMLNTQSATLGLTMRNNLYTALPLNMNGTARDPTGFVKLVPGVQDVSTQAAGTSFASINGGQNRLNGIYIDGMPTTDSAVQGETRFLSMEVSVEAVNQFQVLTNNAPAMYDGQGVENFTIKSGTNKFHGAAYEYFRNTALDAAGYFSPKTPVEHQNEFGVDAGGPIVRNKLFYFGDFDGYFFRQASKAALQSVPTVAERTGDFSAFPNPIYDPLSTTCDASGCTRSQFDYGGTPNVIPPGRLSPVSQSFASYLPKPTNNQLLDNYLTNQTTGLNVFSTTDRVDWQTNNRNLMYFVFSRGQYKTTPLAGISNNTDALPLPYTASRIVEENVYLGQVHDVYTFSPNLINQLGYSFNRLQVPIISATAAGKYPQKAGLKGLPPGQASNAFPSISFSGPDAPESWANHNAIAFNDASNTFVLQDNLQWVHGKHAITFGGQIEWLENNDISPDNGSDVYFNFGNAETANFNPGSTTLDLSTGNAYASYLLGAVSSAGATDNSIVDTGERFHNYAFYVQDDYKPTSKLSLNLGLRYDILGVAHMAFDRVSFLNPTLPNPAIGGYPGILEFGGYGPDSCGCSTPVHTHLLDFAPRFGFEYSINPKTVIRGGYAIMYTRGDATGGALYSGTGQLGFDANPNFESVNPNEGEPAFFWSPQSGLSQTSYSGVYDQGLPPYQHAPFYNPTLNTGYCTGPGCSLTGGGIHYGDPRIGGRPPLYENWSFGIQRSLTPNLTVTLAYSASDGHYLPDFLGRPIYSDQINPKYLALQGLLGQPATPTFIAQANTIMPGIHMPYSNFTGTIGQMLRPFPQYAGVTDQYESIGNSTYNSFQISVRKQMSHGLTFNGSYVFSKEIDDIARSRTAYMPQLEKAVGGIDRPVVASVSFTYALPFGKGQWIGGSNPVMSAIVGNWSLAGIYSYNSGGPLSIGSSVCNDPYTGGACYPEKNPNFSGPIQINGGLSSGHGVPNATDYINKNAFKDVPQFTFSHMTRNAPYGLFAPAVWEQDLTLRRIFPITERAKVNLAVDAFNLFNNVNFGGVSTNFDSSDFGSVHYQANSPRDLQLSARVTF